MQMSREGWFIAVCIPRTTAECRRETGYRLQVTEASRIRVLALSWVVVAIGVTVMLAPILGLRGWVWLGLHHLVMVVTITLQVLLHRRKRAGS